MMKVPLVDWRSQYGVTRSKIRGAIEESLSVIPWKPLPTVCYLCLCLMSHSSRQSSTILSW